MPSPQQQPPRRQRAVGLALVAVPCWLALAGCDIDANEELMRQGHQAMVECQHGERSITGGDELRCEDWEYVRSNYLEAGRREAGTADGTP
jgi:hypothetical protein